MFFRNGYFDNDGHFGLRVFWLMDNLFSNGEAIFENFPCGFHHRDQSNQFLYFPIYTVRVRFQNQKLKNEIIGGASLEKLIYPNR